MTTRYQRKGLSLAGAVMFLLSTILPLQAQDLTPGCRIIPVDPDIGADIPLARSSSFFKLSPQAYFA